MAHLATQRCLNHPAREAAARCPECGRFFCRECIAEHEDRVVCAACLKKLARMDEAPARRRVNPWPVAQGATGFFLAWFIFYVMGRLLLALPDEFHDEALWKAKWLEMTGMGGDD